MSALVDIDTQVPPGPQVVYMSVHLPCNLRCVQCHMYKQANPVGELTLEERVEVLRQLAEVAPKAVVVLAGGEVIARRGQVYALAEAAGALDLPVALTTNGTLFMSSDYRRIPGSGIRNVTFSFDSDEPEVHDRIRGKEGTFERALAGLQRMVAARDASPHSLQVMGSSIIHRHNLDRMEAIVDFFEGQGVDGINFNAVTATLAAELAEEWWTEPLFPDDHDAIDRAVDTLQRLRAAGRPLTQSERKLEDIRRYLKHPQQLQEGHCGAWHQTMMIDMFGNVRLCFEMERAGLEPVGNVRQSRLEDLWWAPETGRARRVMASCREGCGAQNCHAR